MRTWPAHPRARGAFGPYANQSDGKPCPAARGAASTQRDQGPRHSLLAATRAPLAGAPPGPDVVRESRASRRRLRRLSRFPKK
eukprot:scaffold179587_cov29-Tisochrysis_lutea.AAC.2